MSAEGLETNTYQDYATIPGVTFGFSFDIVPLDLTGATATCTISGINPDGTDLVVSVTLTVTNAGAYPTTDFSLSVPATATAAWLVGPYKYQIRVTLADGVTVLPYGTGMVIVR